MDSRRYIFLPDKLLRVGFFSRFIEINKDNLFNVTGPISDDIKQTVIGDCYFLTALRSIIRRQPMFVENVIEILPNNHVAVLFYVHTEPAQFEPVWFELESTIVEHFFNRFTGHGANWVYVFEKAYVFFRLHEMGLIDISESEAKVKSTKSFDFYEVLSGGSAHKSFEALLGCFAISRRIPHPCHSILQLLNYTSGDEICDEIIQFVFRRDWALIRDFINHYSADSNNHVLCKLIKKIKSGEAKAQEVITYFETYFPGLNTNTLGAIRIAILQSIEIIIGHGRYSADSIQIFHSIHDLLRKGELICTSTKEKFPKKANAIGLVEKHTYDLLNCYVRGNNYFLLIGNPWKNYARGYKMANENSSKLRPLTQYSLFFSRRSFRDLKRVDSNSQLRLLAINDEQYSPTTVLNKCGYFEIELNDFMIFFDSFETTEFAKTKKQLKNLITFFNPENEYIVDRLELMNELRGLRNSY